METQIHRSSITCGVRPLLLAATALGVAGHASAQTPTATANFKVGTTVDANGRIPVVADWTTPLSLVTAAATTC